MEYESRAWRGDEMGIYVNIMITKRTYRMDGNGWMDGQMNKWMDG